MRLHQRVIQPTAECDRVRQLKFPFVESTALDERRAHQGNTVFGLSGPCLRNSEDLDYLAHLNTPNLARDLELVRSLTGYEEPNYWGTDYGTAVGIVYAALFPDRVGRMVLDGIPGSL